MQLDPIDLGNSRMIPIVQMRMLAGMNGRNRGAVSNILTIANTNPAPPSELKEGETGKSLGFLGHIQTGGLGLPPEIARRVFDAIKTKTIGMTCGMAGGFGGGFGCNGIWMLASGRPELQIMGSIFTMVGTMGVLGGILIPRFMLQKAYSAPLTASEMSDLIQCAGDNQLMKEYLLLAREAIQQSNLPQQGEKNLREAIRALGDAIDRLPETPLAAANSKEMKLDVETTRSALMNEKDPVVSASLQRRLLAQESSLKSVERAMVISRRTQALRDEIFAQIESVRLGIASFQEGAHETGTNFSVIADSIRLVSAEASSVADAQVELDSYLHTSSVQQTTEEKPLTLQIRG
jgi:hypothetical protein